MGAFLSNESSNPICICLRMSQRPMKTNVGVSAGQCGPESIYLHTSTGPAEARLRANRILASLKCRLWQT